MERCGLYIHIPFCHSKCYYCDFCSRKPKDTEVIDRYIYRLIEEIRDRVNEAPTTVYIGGGTPSILSPKQLHKLISAIDFSRCEEVTIEANPEDVTLEWAKNIADSPIDRVSMGIQSLVDSELKAIGRRHTAADAINAYKRLQDCGIQNISLDLIYGLPSQDLKSWKKSLDTILTLMPNHLSAYLLSFEPHTVLTARLQKGLISECNQEVAEEMFLYLCEASAAKGYSHYEISNLALPGFEARHNSSYWDGTPYIGIGIAAHSFDGIIRQFNNPDIKCYLNEGYTKNLTVDSETQVQRFNDMVITRLRTASGLSLKDCIKIYGEKYTQLLLDNAGEALESGHLILSPDQSTLSIPQSYWLISDSILIDLILSPED